MDQMSPSSNIRRLSIQDGKEDGSMTLTTRSLQQVRSVVVLRLTSSLIILVLRSSQVLRVMDLWHCDLSHCYNLNKCLGNLFHLWFLGLRNCRCFTTDSLPWVYPGQFVQTSAYAELNGKRKRQSIYHGSDPRSWSSNSLTSSRR